MKKFLYQSYLNISRFLMSLRSTGHICNGCIVKYEDCKYEVLNSNLIIQSSENSRLIKIIPLYDSTGKWIWVRYDKVNLIKTPSNIVKTALYWYKWYRECWLKIDLNSLLRGEHTIKSVEVLGDTIAHNRRMA